MSTIIDLFLDDNFLSHGIIKWVPWDMEKAPMGIIVGQSGSGKTYASQILLAKICQKSPCEIYLMDAKSDKDFEYLNGLPHFYRYDKCRTGLHQYYERFLNRQNGTDKTRHPLILFFDEWSSYCNAGKKTEIEEDKKILGLLMSLGRSFSCFVIISQQRADAVYFNQFRDNFSLCLGMSNLSDESRKMLFPDYAKELPPDRCRGTGYLAFNGTKPIPITVPPIRRTWYVQNLIKEAVSRTIS